MSQSINTKNKYLNTIMSFHSLQMYHQKLDITDLDIRYNKTLD